MSAKTPDSAPDPASSTSSVPAQPKPAVPPASPVGGGPAGPVTAAPPPAAVGRPVPRKTGSGGALVLLALLAILVALGSAGVSVYALDQARNANSRANEAKSVADRAATPSPTSAAAVPTHPAGTPTATPTRVPAFIAELVRANLKVQAPPSQCASVYVDIDKMTVGDLTGHEFYLSNCVGPLSFHVDRTSGAVPTPNNPTAEVCAAQITSETAGTELVLPVVTGLTFCLLTNRADAAQQGIPQRIAIVEVREVGADNSVTVAVSTYRVPGTA